MANMTRAQLMAKILEMNAAKEPAQAALVRALAAVVSGPDASRIKHLFYRADSGTSGGVFQLSLDMHE